MTSFELISTNISSGAEFDKRPQQVHAIHILRTMIFVAILLVAVTFQVTHEKFINLDVSVPVYLTLATEFLISAIYFFFFQKFSRLYLSEALILGIDAIVITGVIYFTGISQSVFIFLYLINIIFTGLIYQRRGALLMALWSSTLLSLVLLISPEIEGQSLYFAVGLNNLAFFAVATLSGLLSEQLNVMGRQLTAKTKDLQALQGLNQLIVENIGSGLITVDLDLKVTFANRGAAMTLDDLGLVGKRLTNIFGGLSENIKNGELKKARALRLDEDFVNYKNERLHLTTLVSPLLGSERELKGYVILFSDVTQMKRLETQMRQQDKLAAIGRLAAGIAHEIRNPLASISGSIQLMSGSTEGMPAEHQKLMRIVLREIDRLNDLISEFLEFVKPNNNPSHPVDINQLIQEVLEMVRFNKSVRVDVQQESSLKSTAVLLGDFDKLKQALLNIIINAYQAMEKTQFPKIMIHTKDVDNQVVVTIADNGEGIDQKNLRHIFEPFHTTKPKGTGLGLAITHKIMESHEARIFVESERGRGTKFTLEFPVRQHAETADGNGERKRA
jgi:two-component system sensor histidine kinase PilS (NtrC family)